jgi:hypothetical protein
MCGTDVEVFYNYIGAIQNMQTPNCLVPEIQIMNAHFPAILKTDKTRTTKSRQHHNAIASCLGKLLSLLTLLTAKTGPFCS